MHEELAFSDLTVIGSIPAGLGGQYLKMGVNRFHSALRGHEWFIGVDHASRKV